MPKYTFSDMLGYMKVNSAEFVKGIVGDDNILRDGIPQIAFIGRSNVGKSSMINAITGVKGLCRSSSTPGRTQEINFFLINRKYYLVDLPGYGYAQGSHEKKDFIFDLIKFYIFENPVQQEKIVLILDAKTGPTKDDLAVLDLLERSGKNLIIVMNKIDKLNANELRKSKINIENLVGAHTIIACSTKDGTGIRELAIKCFNNS